MSEPRGMGRRVIAVVGLALALALAASASAQTPESEKAAVDARIAALQAEIAAAKAQEGVLTSQLSAVVAELEDAQSAVDTAQASLSTLEAELVAAQARLDELTALLASADAAARAPPDRVREGGGDPRGARTRRVHRRATGRPRLPRLGVELRRDHRQRRAGLTNRCPGSAHRAAGGEGSRRGGRRAEGDDRHETSAGRDGLRDLGSRTEEARVVRDQLAGDRDASPRSRISKTSALSDTRETREEYLREVEALAAESAALAARIRDAQEGAGSTGTGQAVGGRTHLALRRRGRQRLRDALGTHARGHRHRVRVRNAEPGCASGTVIYSGWLGGYGNLVVVDHGNGLSTAYAHASSLLVGVGQSVSQGETVSLVGSTGNSSGPHLHFEVRVNGEAVDPC